MLTKKYFSISEACGLCNLPSHKLRYIDKIDKNISIIQIRGRRYYTKENISYLIKTYSNIQNPTLQKDNHDFIKRIDTLISNFRSLAKSLK